MRIIKTGLLFMFLIVIITGIKAQMGFVNNGMVINIEQGAYIYVNDFYNDSAGTINGKINLDGDLMVTGDFTNNSGGNVFDNIEATPDGNVTLCGTNQFIQGTTPIFFENLYIKNATKTLNLNNCVIKGIDTIDGVLDLNKNRLIIDNNNPGAISYKSGYIKSETTPIDGLGEIEWKTGSAPGTFSVPFGSGKNSDNDLNLSLSALTTADPDTGSIVFATYPTDGSNKPYPAGVFSLDTFLKENVADRYWEIKPNYNTKPDVSVLFRYTPDDVDQSDNPDLFEKNLKAIRYNDVTGKWTDMKMTGICDAANKTVLADNITSDNFFPYWTLSEYELKIPNAFTPFDDEPNNYFLKGYTVKIVNRWGEKLFEGPDGWDGTTENGKKVSPGTYYYIAAIPGLSGDKTATGVITLISK